MFADILLVLSVSMICVDGVFVPCYQLTLQPPLSVDSGPYFRVLAVDQHRLRRWCRGISPSQVIQDARDGDLWRTIDAYVIWQGQCPPIISRAEWGARPSKSIQYLPQEPVQYAFIHHSAGRECFNKSDCAAVVRSYQDFHMDTRGWDDIGYSYVIGGDGSVFEGRGWDRVGAHTLSYNSVGLGFCLSGNFMTHLPTTIQMDTVKQLIAYGVSLGKISSNYTLRGHRDMVTTTSCPGDMFYKLIQTWDHY